MSHDAHASSRQVHYSDGSLKDGSFDSYLEAQAVLTDLLFLSEGDLFVGKFTSNIDRIAYALMAARHNFLVPFISLDSTWCLDFGRKVGRTSRGKLFYC